jgi:hypothetical protein
MSSNLEGRMLSITRPTGSYAVITCDIHRKRNYIHWYHFKEGKAPKYLSYYDILKSTHVLVSELSQRKYDSYEGTDRSYKFVIQNVDKSDSGIYYCATWTGTVIQTCLYLHRKFALWHFLVHKLDQPPSHFLSRTSLYSEERKKSETITKALSSQQLNLAHNCTSRAFLKANYHIQDLAKQSGQVLPGAGAGSFNLMSPRQTSHLGSISYMR